MKDIWKVIAEIGLEMHPDNIESIADKISNLSSMNDFSKVKNKLSSNTSKAKIQELYAAWLHNQSLTSKELAAALRAAKETALIVEKHGSIEMVWTGPLTGFVASRHTEQVLLEVIRSAVSSLFIVSFVSYDIESIKEAIKDAINRNVNVDILLESSLSHGGKVSIDSIDAFKKTFPTANIYAWNTNSKSTEQWNGAVHAKCAVADSTLAFITSANLTRAAMERNMELGVLVRGGSLPENLDKHLRSLIITNVINKLMD